MRGLDKERWHVEIADFDEQYFSTPAPVIIDNHVIVGTGNDLDGPGFLQAVDPETGKLQWKFYTVPMKAGDPGLETWPNLDAAKYGGGHTWMPGSYDPETRLYIFGTGNPTPAYTGVGRPGDNLYTCALVAVNVDTGKMAWYYQMSPHDTHDWDTVQNPMLIDTTLNGKPRKLVSVAARNGYFFTVDRVTGEHIVTTKYGTYTNWAGGLNSKKAPWPAPEKEAIIPGALVSPVEGGTTNWQPSAYSPDTGLVYTQEANSFNMLYLTDPDPRGSMGLGGKLRVEVGSAGKFLTAIEPATGQSCLASQVREQRRRRHRVPHDRRRITLRRRRRRQPDRARCQRRQTALAHARRQHQQRASDVRDRRETVPAGRYGRSAVGLYSLLNW